MVKVEVVYISVLQKTIQFSCSLMPGSTVRDALEKSQIFQDYPETQGLKIGIFSQPVSLEHILHEGDRIEIYRPLMQDPKEKRRQRAKIDRKA